MWVVLARHLYLPYQKDSAPPLLDSPYSQNCRGRRTLFSLLPPESGTVQPETSPPTIKPSTCKEKVQGDRYPSGKSQQRARLHLVLYVLSGKPVLGARLQTPPANHLAQGFTVPSGLNVPLLAPLLPFVLLEPTARTLAQASCSPPIVGLS